MIIVLMSIKNSDFYKDSNTITNSIKAIINN